MGCPLPLSTENQLFSSFWVLFPRLNGSSPSMFKGWLLDIRFTRYLMRFVFVVVRVIRVVISRAMWFHSYSCFHCRAILLRLAPLINGCFIKLIPGNVPTFSVLASKWHRLETRRRSARRNMFFFHEIAVPSLGKIAVSFIMGIKSRKRLSVGVSLDGTIC